MRDTRSAKEIWEAAKGILQIELSRHNYETWVKDTIGLSYQKNLFVIGTPNAFAGEWLEERLLSLVKKTLISIIGQEVEVQFQICQGAFPQAKGAPNLNLRYTFDTFIVGSCNRLAHAAALGVAEDPGHSYNPLFIYGGVGLGKTHLVQAIGHVAFANGFQVLYTSTEQFTNEFITAIRERKTEDFRTKFRNVDFLLIDDIHFIAGKEQTQESFFHTFNDLHNANKQIVLTSDRHPRSLTLLEDRLRSRFEWGLITDIQPPDLETRLAILQVKSEQQGVNPSKEVLDFLARRYQKNIRELEGSLNRVIAYAKLTREPITIELTEKALRDVGDIGAQKLTPTFILNTVAKHFSLSLEALQGKQRDQKTALARQIAMYLVREETHCPLEEIGELLGGKDHSTVLYGHQRILTQMEVDPTLRQTVLGIREALYSPPKET